jgi:hypothetical protein
MFDSGAVGVAVGAFAVSSDEVIGSPLGSVSTAEPSVDSSPLEHAAKLSARLKAELNARMGRRQGNGMTFMRQGCGLIWNSQAGRVAPLRGRIFPHRL